MNTPLPPPPPPPGARRRRGGCALLFLAAAAGCVVLLAALLGLVLFRAAPEAPDGAVLVVDAAAAYPEALAQEPLPFSEPAITFRELVEAVTLAAEDPRIGGLHLEVDGASLGWARARTLREAAAAFRESGKPVTAALTYAGLLDYYLATAAETIHVHPIGQLALHGIVFEVALYGDLFEKVGVEVQSVAVGRYKTAPQAWTRARMTAEHREQLTGIGRDFRAEVTRAVAEGRRLGEEEAERLSAGGPYTASEAVGTGLADRVSYADEVDEALGGERVSPASYLRSRGAPDGAGARVAVVHIHGAIVPGKSGLDLLFGTVAGADTVVEAIEWAEEEESVDAVVLRVSSPGGVDTASEDIWRAARRAGADKPVLASFGDVAASGGYWVATAAREVWADPLSVTGSIGIFVIRPSVGGLLDKMGISVETVEVGAESNWLNPARPLDEAEMERLREMVGEGYERFLTRVSGARGMTPEEVDRVGQGRVFTGGQAVGAGLVDELGGLDRAVRAAAVAAGFDPEDPVEVVTLPRPPTLFDRLEAELSGGGFRSRSRLLLPALRGARLALLPFVPTPR